MELYPIQRGVVVLLVALCMETRISSGLGGWGHLAQVQVSPFMNLQVSGSLRNTWKRNVNLSVAV